jgi:thymidine kinase
MSQNPQFTVFCGPMFSSKTSKLLMSLEKFKYQNKKAIAFKPKIDDRYSETDIVTHSGWKHDAVLVETGADVIKHLSDCAEVYEIVAVDELFMIPDIAGVLIWLFQRGITIVVSTLDLSHAGKPFEELTKIMPYATHIEKCSSVCTVCGHDAFYTHRKIQNNDELFVGGAEAYEPRCFRHFVPINKVEDLT